MRNCLQKACKRLATCLWMEDCALWRKQNIYKRSLHIFVLIKNYAAICIVFFTKHTLPKCFASLLKASLASLASSSAILWQASCKPFACLLQAISYKLISVCTVLQFEFEAIGLILGERTHNKLTFNILNEKSSFCLKPHRLCIILNWSATFFISMNLCFRDLFKEEPK